MACHSWQRQSAIPDRGSLPFLTETVCHSWQRQSAIPDRGSLPFLTEAVCHSWQRQSAIPDRGSLPFLTEAVCHSWQRQSAIPDRGSLPFLTEAVCHSRQRQSAILPRLPHVLDPDGKGTWHNTQQARLGSQLRPCNSKTANCWGRLTSLEDSRLVVTVPGLTINTAWNKCLRCWRVCCCSLLFAIHWLKRVLSPELKKDQVVSDLMQCKAKYYRKFFALECHSEPPHTPRFLQARHMRASRWKGGQAGNYWMVDYITDKLTACHNHLLEVG